jgi:hypothetical protein
MIPNASGRKPGKGSGAKPASKAAVVVAIVIAVAIVCGLGYYFLRPQPAPGGVSQAALDAAHSRYQFAVDRWNKEVAAAKREHRQPDYSLEPRPTGAGGRRVKGFDGMGPGSLATRPGGSGAPAPSGK